MAVCSICGERTWFEKEGKRAKLRLCQRCFKVSHSGFDDPVYRELQQLQDPTSRLEALQRTHSDYYDGFGDYDYDDR